MRGLFAIVAASLLCGCNGPPSGNESGARASPHDAREEYERATRCEALTGAIARLPAGVLRDEAAALGLTVVTPEIHARWMSRAREAARSSRLSEAEQRATVRRNAVAIRSAAQIGDVADEAFDCAVEVGYASTY